MSRSPRRPARLAVVVLTGLLLTGCGTNQVRSGAAAIVGDERISAEQLQAVVDRGLADPAAAAANSDRAAYQRSVLTRLINTIVLRKAADEAGVTVTEGQVDKQLQAYIATTPTGTLAELEKQASEQAGISARDLRPFVRNVVLDEALGDELTKELEVPPAALQELYAQNPEFDKVRTAHILVPTAKQAADLLAQVKADRTRFAALAKQFSTDTSNKDKGGDLGLVGRGSFVKEFEDAVFAARQGDLLQVKTEFGFHVVAVLERRTTSLAEATPQLRRQALSAERDQAKTEALRKAADELGVRVSPRFGTWSTEQNQVVERESELSRPADGAPGDDGPAQPGEGEQPPADGGAGQPPAGGTPGQPAPAEGAPTDQPTQ